MSQGQTTLFQLCPSGPRVKSTNPCIKIASIIACVLYFFISKPSPIPISRNGTATPRESRKIFSGGRDGGAGIPFPLTPFPSRPARAFCTSQNVYSVLLKKVRAKCIITVPKKVCTPEIAAYALDFIAHICYIINTIGNPKSADFSNRMLLK